MCLYMHWNNLIHLGVLILVLLCVQILVSFARLLITIIADLSSAPHGGEKSWLPKVKRKVP